MLLLHKFILTIFVALMLPLSGSAKADMRKVALDLSNLPVGWQFHSKSAAKTLTTRQFRNPAGEQIYVYARQFKTPKLALTEFRRWRADDVAGEYSYPRLAPKRPVDAYARAAWQFDVWSVEKYYIVIGDTLLSFAYASEFTNVTPQRLLACEALQIDRLKRPAASGICPFEAIDVPEE